jgi:hypothetical protein
MIASGRVHIPVAATYALSSIKEAVEALPENRVRQVIGSV